MSVIVVPVDSPALLDRFLSVGEAVYREDPDAVLPLRALLRRRLRARQGGHDTSLHLLLAMEDDRAVGTISVLRDRRHEEHQEEAVAFFGFFEVLEGGGARVAEALFAAARARARALGASVLRGPRNFSRIEETGLTVQGWGTRPPMLAGHHPARYQPLLEDQGFVPHHEVLAYDTPMLTEDGAQRTLPEHLQAKADAVDIPGLAVRDASMLHIVRDLRVAHHVFVEGFRDVPENTPMPLSQWLAVGAPLLALTDPKMLQLATVNGEPAGFALCFPDPNEAVVAAGGRATPAGLFRALRATRRIRTASFKLLGVLPEHRGTGLHAKLIARAIDGCQRAGFHRLEASLIDGRNKPMRGIVETAGMEVYRRYRVYEQPLSA
jgi:GNAT superfamily N-acetyltransferase